MARYQYAGPGPVPDPESTEIIRPGDIREFPEEPAYGPWELLDGPDTPAPDPPAPAATPAPLSVPSTYENPTVSLNTPKGF